MDDQKNYSKSKHILYLKYQWYIKNLNNNYTQEIRQIKVPKSIFYAKRVNN